MDLTQVKLTRTEWDSIEVPVSESEKEILSLIMEGFSNINITKNKTMSLFSFTKIEKSPESEFFLYNKYFAPIIQKTIRKYCEHPILKPIGEAVTQTAGTLKKMKSVDLLRIQNLDANIESNKKVVYEFLVLEFCNELCRYLGKDNTKYAYYLYTLIQLAKSSIVNVNSHVLLYMNKVIDAANSITDLSKIVERAFVFIEQNPYLLEYEDKTLFQHQKQLFSIFRNQSETASRLVLYIAPTGTGKTLSPIGLSVNYRIIFVCVARHIGLALAKSAISMEKKIAFAFGAETASDIRLHYFAASDYTKDWRSGGIRKVNNAVGDKVEIMICDVQSYLIAMRYMLAFNPAEKIITYWDEPTITMDYETHDLHEVIHNNWVENKIPNIVLSCATLPREEEILDTIADFRARFDDAEVHTIASYDCRKSIPIITKDGYCALPHTMYESYTDLMECANYCAENKTLLRYFDLSEIVEFITYLNKMMLVDERFMMRNYFADIASITMNSLKLYYLEVLQQIEATAWPSIYKHMKYLQKPKFNAELKKSVSIDSSTLTKTAGGGGALSRMQSVSSTEPTTAATNSASSGILLTTADAHTLTAGPTIFLTEDAKKIGTFYTQQSEIPKAMFQDLLTKIKSNDKASIQLEELERTLEAMTQPDPDKKTKQKEKDDESQGPAIKDMYRKIDTLRKQIRTISLDAVYVPNTTQHQTKWAGQINDAAFCPNISEEVVKEIMGLYIDNSFKLLLLLGIGIFIRDVDSKYLEVMKRLASNQELFIIIASSDFVFGTNYNFCHGFIGKDMANMTQAKTIQCLGRIGRSSIQSTYTVRFRDDGFIYNLFKTPTLNREAINMSKLFST
jgi:hypothetical protein